ncbi:MAG: VWA domain-containing protein [Spirulina sp. SIO3F2]|nr:VWA domain-containing protein [Spirulina sp. SIO3F2]
MHINWSGSLTTLLWLGFGGVLVNGVMPPAIAQVQTETTPETATTPTSGLFVTTRDGEQRAFPLQHTEVDAQIAGNVSRVAVTQTFENPFDEPLEAIYVFPLPDEAAVDEMEIKIGDRIIKGDIKKREEARAIYEQARQEGRTAGLLEQERANIFTQSLANIRPGEQIKVTIRYSDSLQFEGGDYEFVFPMVVGPRFIPGKPLDPDALPPADPLWETWGHATDQVPDADRITPPVLPPGMRSGHDINVTVQIDAGGLVQDVRSPSHAIQTEQAGEVVTVTLDPADTIPNKDLILRYRVSGANTEATVLTQADEKGGHFALYLIPALDYRPNQIVPKDVVFLMDTSGSQSGAPIAQSKRLMERFINGLNADDTFTVIDFANATQSLSPQPLANTAANRELALDYVAGLSGNGGTQLLNGIDTVLNFPPAAHGRLRSVVLLTDGLIGNDNAVIARIKDELPYGNRLYSFGVGSGVNRFLLDRLAEVGRGTLHVVRHDEPIDEVVEQFFGQINNPVLTNIRVTWQGEGRYPQIYPQYVPDLFASQPLVLFGRNRDRQPGILRVTGTTAQGRRYSETFEVSFDAQGNPAIAQLWGRARIKELMTRMTSGETRSGVEAVTQTALDYNLLSQYTAFVAVSEEVRVDPDGTTRTVDVPVELLDGTQYEGFFGTNDDELESRVRFLDPSGSGVQDGATYFSAPSSTARPAPSPTAPPLQPQAVPPPVGDTAVYPAQEAPINPRIDTEQLAEIQTQVEVLHPSPANVLSTTAQNASLVALSRGKPYPDHTSDQKTILVTLLDYIGNLELPNDLGTSLNFEFVIQDGKVTEIHFPAFDVATADIEQLTLVQEIRDYINSLQFPTDLTNTYEVQLYVYVD